MNFNEIMKNIKETTYEEALSLAKEWRTNKQEGTIFSIAQRIGYSIGKDSSLYKEEKFVNNDVYKGFYNGGCCVVFKDDVCIFDASKDKSLFGLKCMQLVEDYLTTKGLLIRKNGNDLLLYEDGIGEKICSYAISQNDNGFYETVVHVSIGMDKQLILDTCTKNGKYVNRGLKEFNITPKEIIEYIKTNLN